MYESTGIIAPSLTTHVTVAVLVHHITEKQKKTKTKKKNLPRHPLTMPDIFDDILDLEGNFYSEGYAQGWQDGLMAGRAEGRALGIERGFQKFFEAGRLYGRSIVWENRLPRLPDSRPGRQNRRGHISPKKNRMGKNEKGNSVMSEEGDNKAEKSVNSGTATSTSSNCRRPPLRVNERLRRNIAIIHDLMEPETLPTENSDDAVEDVDDRIRRAQAKARVVEKALGETAPSQDASARTGKNENIEDAGNLNVAALPLSTS